MWFTSGMRAEDSLGCWHVTKFPATKDRYAQSESILWEFDDIEGLSTASFPESVSHLVDIIADETLYKLKLNHDTVVVGK